MLSVCTVCQASFGLRISNAGGVGDDEQFAVTGFETQKLRYSSGAGTTRNALKEFLDCRMDMGAMELNGTNMVESSVPKS